MSGDIAKELRQAVNKAMDHAGTLPAKEAVKVRPQDWNAVIDVSRKTIAALDAKDKRKEQAE